MRVSTFCFPIFISPSSSHVVCTSAIWGGDERRRSEDKSLSILFDDFFVRSVSEVTSVIDFRDFFPRSLVFDVDLEVKVVKVPFRFVFLCAFTICLRNTEHREDLEEDED